MTDPVSQYGAADQSESTVSFGERMVASASFKALFREGMSLVEATAAYLDGDGRQASKGLDRHAALAYATESMRLTTRLMQLASWLLLQRAVNEGEMTPQQAMSERNKVRVTAVAPEPEVETLDLLPAPLSELIHQSLRLQARIRHLDESASAGAEPDEAQNAVASQLDRLRQAFPS